MKKSLIQKLGLLGVVSFLSYTAAVVFAPLAYPGYHWMAQAVSDLSAANAPSLALWNQLSALYRIAKAQLPLMVDAFQQHLEIEKHIIFSVLHFLNNADIMALKKITL